MRFIRRWWAREETPWEKEERKVKLWAQEIDGGQREEEKTRTPSQKERRRARDNKISFICILILVSVCWRISFT